MCLNKKPNHAELCTQIILQWYDDIGYIFKLMGIYRFSPVGCLFEHEWTKNLKEWRITSQCVTWIGIAQIWNNKIVICLFVLLIVLEINNRITKSETETLVATCK